VLLITQSPASNNGLVTLIAVCVAYVVQECAVFLCCVAATAPAASAGLTYLHSLRCRPAAEKAACALSVLTASYCCLLLQASYAFQVLEGALGLILAKLDEFSSLAAETVRLDGLLTALQAADVDAGGSGTVQGFEQPAAGPAGLWGVLTGLRVASVAAIKRKKGPAKSEAGTADTKAAAAAASDADDDEVGEATGLLLHADRASNRRASGSTEALPAAAGGVGTASQQWGVSTGNGSGGGRLSRVLRLMDGAAAGFCAEELSAWVPGRHHMPTCVCSELSFSIAPGELDAQQLSGRFQ
jgi:hypothetical protein